MFFVFDGAAKGSFAIVIYCVYVCPILKQQFKEAQISVLRG